MSLPLFILYPDNRFIISRNKTLPRFFKAGFLFLIISLLLNACATSPSASRLSITAMLRDLPVLPDHALLTDVPFFSQKEYQCGPAALAMMMTYRQVVVSPDDLVQQIYLPERHGTLTPEIVAAVRKYEFVPYVFTTGLHDLLIEVAAGNPVLVMQNLGLSWYPVWHYAVVIGYDLNQQTLVLRSGLEPERITTLRNFENTWKRANHWAMVIPARDQLPATVNVLTWLQDAEDLAATGHYDAAHNSYEIASQKWPRDDLVWFALGNSFYQKQNMSDAELSYRQALEIKRNNPDVLNNLAYALSAQGCRNEALQAATCALQLSPGNSNVEQTIMDIDKTLSLMQSPAHCANIRDALSVSQQ